jgi:hypothetical protein
MDAGGICILAYATDKKKEFEAGWQRKKGGAEAPPFSNYEYSLVTVVFTSLQRTRQGTSVVEHDG